MKISCSTDRSSYMKLFSKLNNSDSKFFLAVLVTISIFILLTNTLIILNLVDLSADQLNLINIAGRQRMLSQKMAKDVLLYVNGEIQFSRIEEAISEFEKNLDDIKTGNEQRDIPFLQNDSIYAQHIVVSNGWSNFKKNLLVLKEEPDNYFAREYIISYNEIFLNKIDRLVDYYEEDAVHEEILKYQLMILVFGTIIILVTWLVVRRIIYKSGIDQLTKVYNRRRGAQHLRRLIQSSIEKNKDLSLIIFDIDDFKKVNDTYGHNAGDEVLKKIVEVVKSSIRDKDILVRWGGEEFLILTPDIDIDTAISVAERVRETVAEYQFAEVGQITCSFGVSQLKKDEEDESFAELIKRADDALYYAKGNSKNMVSSRK